MKRTRATVSREADGFDAFYIAGYPVIYRAAYAFSSSREIATEATQEAFVRAFARWRRLRGEHWAMGWVMTTALNEARSLQKKGRRRFVMPVDSPSSSNDQVDRRLDLIAQLATLPARQKQAIVLHYIAGYQVHEVAELMDVSAGAVKSHLFKARASLRSMATETLKGTHDD